jgi:hypothetical protein
MSCCGLWPTPRRLVAVVLDAEDAPCETLTVARSEDGRGALGLWLHPRADHVVLTDELARAAPWALWARALGLQVWVAPAVMVHSVRQVAALADRSAKHSAALLARWPRAPALRPYLRIMSIPAADRQLTLC